MRDMALLRTDMIGSVIAALCSATPILVILLGTFELSAFLSWTM